MQVQTHKLFNSGRLTYFWQSTDGCTSSYDDGVPCARTVQLLQRGDVLMHQLRITAVANRASPLQASCPERAASTSTLSRLGRFCEMMQLWWRRSWGPATDEHAEA